MGFKPKTRVTEDSVGCYRLNCFPLKVEALSSTTCKQGNRVSAKIDLDDVIRMGPHPV